MILDSEVWKNELSNELIKIKRLTNEIDSPEKFYIELQKFSIYTSIIIRKLIESNKISVELLSQNYEIKKLEKIEIKSITYLNRFDIEKLYDVEHPLKENISIKLMCDYFIHSFHFILKFSWQQINEEINTEDIEDWEIDKLIGIYISSNKTKSKGLFFIELKTYLKIIEDVINDFIVSVHITEKKVICSSKSIIK
jgi:hypothetical protein